MAIKVLGILCVGQYTASEVLKKCYSNGHQSTRNTVCRSVYTVPS
jgi:ribosomal protein L32